MYMFLLQLLRQFILNLNPKTIMLNFEISAIKAFKKQFRDIKIGDCYFTSRNIYYEYIYIIYKTVC